MSTADEHELAALLTRAAIVEAQRQAAEAHGDAWAAGDAALELERLWHRYATLAQAVGFDSVRCRPR